MSVCLYLGLPGDGKSMAGMRRIVDWLTTTEGYVMTNLPVEMGELSSYLYTLGFHRQSAEVSRRVTILAEKEVRKFWLYRPYCWRLVDLQDHEWSLNRYPSLQKLYRWREGYEGERQQVAEMAEEQVKEQTRLANMEQGDMGELKLSCLYVIDECQNFWPARSYQNTPKGLLFYLSQHRHVGDECVFITQKEAQVEKTIRNLVLEFWVYRNLGQRRRLGFKLPGMFGYACYDQPPSSQGAQFIGCGTFKMDTKGLAACYRTADGVGVGGSTMKADVGRKRSGLAWQWALVVFGLILLGVYFAPRAINGLVKKWLLPAMDYGAAAVVANVTNTPVAIPLLPVTPPSMTETVIVHAVKHQAAAVVEVAKPDWTNSPSIVGSLRTDVGWWVSLSDGRTLGPEDYFQVRSAGGGVSEVQLRKSEPWLRWTTGKGKPAP